MNNSETLLINAGWIITVDANFSVLKQHSLLIENGLITALFATGSQSPAADTVLDLPQHVLMPGLINAHGHAAMSLFRGLADDFELMTWLEQYIWPAEGQYVDADFVRDGTELAMAEMIRSGTTTFSDMYFFPEQAAAAAEKAGMRGQFAFPIFDVPSAWGSGAEEYLQKGLGVIDQFKDSALVNIVFGPHAPYTVSDGPLATIRDKAAAMNKPIQMHLHETAFEVNSAVDANGTRPVQRMADLGLLSERFQAVHMTTLNDDDIATIKKHGAHIIHCPESNLKLASGMCPVQQCLNAGINVALGTDGAASNNDLDMFSEMRTAALLGKTAAGDATAISAETAIRMATINGAKALGIDDRCGSLDIGKAADLIAIDFSALEQQPLYHPVSQLVYTNIAHKVTHSWVNGQCLMADRKLQTLNEQRCLEKAQYWQQKLQHLAS